MAPLDAESFTRYVLDFPLMVRGAQRETRERLGYAENQDGRETTSSEPENLTNVDTRELLGSSDVVGDVFQAEERPAVRETAKASGTAAAAAAAASEQPVGPVDAASEELGEGGSAQNDEQRRARLTTTESDSQANSRVIHHGLGAPRFRPFEQTLSFPGISVPIEAFCREFRALRAFAGVKYAEKELTPGVAEDMKLRFRELQQMYNWISGVIAKHSPERLTVEELMELENLRKDLRHRRLLVLSALEDRHKVRREDIGDQHYVDTTTRTVQSIVTRVEG